MLLRHTRFFIAVIHSSLVGDVANKNACCGDSRRTTANEKTAL